MTNTRRVQNIIGISDTLWQLNRSKVIKFIEQECGHDVPEECYELIERGFRYGAVIMEKAIKRRENA